MSNIRQFANPWRDKLRSRSFREAVSPRVIQLKAAGISHQYRTPVLPGGIYFPQMERFAWLKAIVENRRTIFKLVREGFAGGLLAATPSIAAPVIAERRN